MVASTAGQYFFAGNIEPDLLLGITLGMGIVWLIISRPRKSWLYWLILAFTVLTTPAILVGFIWSIAFLLAVEIPLPVSIAVYILGAFLMLFLFRRRTSRYTVEEIFQPSLDERGQTHLSLSGLWSFFFLNLLIIGALLQPWVPLGQIGLWIGVLMSGLIFWIICLFILEQKR